MLVASAGITGPNTTLWEYPVDAWRQVIDVNLNGCSTATAPSSRTCSTAAMAASSIVASVAGKEGNPNASAYSTSKAAVIGLTKSLGKELAKNEHHASTA